MSTNTFESKLGQVTVRGKAHSTSAWFVVALRLMIGYAFLYSGATKILESGWSAQGYLLNAVPEASPMYGVFQWMGSSALMNEFLALAIPWGEFLIGLAIIVGLFTRLAAFWGAFMMLMFYFSNWDVAHGVINSDFAYMLVFLSVAAFGAGRIIGLDSIIERHGIVQKYPKLKYILG